MSADAEAWGTASFAVDERAFRALLPTALSACQFPQRDIQDATRTATGTLESKHQNLGISKRTQLKLQWSPAGDGRVAVRWLVTDITPPHSAFVNPRMMRRVAEVLSSEVEPYLRQPSPAVAHSPVVAPGERLPAAFTGIPQDYSACATLDELQAFRQGRCRSGAMRPSASDPPRRRFRCSCPRAVGDAEGVGGDAHLRADQHRQDQADHAMGALGERPRLQHVHRGREGQHVRGAGRAA